MNEEVNPMALDVRVERKGPLLIVRGEPAPLALPKEAKTFEGRCTRCGKMWRYRVGDIDAHEVVSDATEAKARALNLFAAYTRKGIGPCCIPPNDRIYIAKHAGSVYYERLD
jgi:hypothetical protein